MSKGKVLAWSLLSMGAGVVVAVAVLVVVVSTVECTRTSVEDVQTKIERDLPLGTPAPAILQWLQENDIEFLSEGPVGRYPELQARGISPDLYVIAAGIANTGDAPILTTKHIRILFLLDAKGGRLTRVIVEEIRTSL